MDDPGGVARVIKAVWALNCAGVLILDLKPRHIIVPLDGTCPVKIVDVDLSETVVNTTTATVASSANVIQHSTAFRGNAQFASIYSSTWVYLLIWRNGLTVTNLLSIFPEALSR
ncbi:hypothetical protein Pelo_7848 [Pelomyxa schiedti]|nr:hypothetical protein Pelo_7848 [Pelomyxa schiedti]